MEACSLTATPISVWSSAFAWWPLSHFSPERIFPLVLEGRCLLCELTVPRSEFEAHARSHRREIRDYRERRVAVARLRSVNRLRKEARA